ncbi:MAG: B12-binding domain-containing protein [Planctomycetaceae bacterium]|nr:B12-binding domain-containing protein [Planctomycetaceae bacterium]
MSRTFSPKQVATAIGVSESSLKRWCDRGLIRMEKTAGGHRRLSLESVTAFIREQGRSLAHPELLGFPVATGQTERSLDAARTCLLDAFLQADEPLCRTIILDLHLAGHSAATICDQVITAVFHEVGKLWETNQVEVYQERQACELGIRVVHELRYLIPMVSENRPLALGGTLDGDPYTLAVTMAEVVLKEAGWNARSMGHMLPFETIRTAVERHRPGLLWLSVSAIRNEDRFCDEMHRLFELANARGTAVVLGGRALQPEIRRRLRYTTYCDTYQHLSDISRMLLADINVKQQPQ